MITVALTSLEAYALEQAGDAEDMAIEGLLHISLHSKGMSQGEAGETAKRLADAALSARSKIAEATRYEIKIVD